MDKTAISDNKPVRFEKENKQVICKAAGCGGALLHTSLSAECIHIVSLAFRRTLHVALVAIRQSAGGRELHYNPSELFSYGREDETEGEKLGRNGKEEKEKRGPSPGVTWGGSMCP